MKQLEGDSDECVNIKPQINSVELRIPLRQIHELVKLNSPEMIDRCLTLQFSLTMQQESESSLRSISEERARGRKRAPLD